MGVLGEKQRVVQVVHKEGRNRHPPPVVDSGRNRDFYPVFRGFSGFLAKNGRFSGFSGGPARTPRNTPKTARKTPPNRGINVSYPTLTPLRSGPYHSTKHGAMIWVSAGSTAAPPPPTVTHDVRTFYPSLYFVGKMAKFSDAATQTLTGLRRGTLNQRNFFINNQYIIRFFYYI